jgi:hypothetical protein
VLPHISENQGITINYISFLLIVQIIIYLLAFPMQSLFIFDIYLRDLISLNNSSSPLKLLRVLLNHGSYPFKKYISMYIIEIKSSFGEAAKE